jgi:uncharacterized protein (DUF302 family)
MDTSAFSAKVDHCLDETLLKLRESLSRERFEIISEDDVSYIAGVDAVRQNVRLLCKCNTEYSAAILKNEKALSVPVINILLHEINQNSTEVTFIDPQLSLTPIQVSRVGQAAVKISKTVKKAILYL